MVVQSAAVVFNPSDDLHLIFLFRLVQLILQIMNLRLDITNSARRRQVSIRNQMRFQVQVITYHNGITFSLSFCLMIDSSWFLFKWDGFPRHISINLFLKRSKSFKNEGPCIDNSLAHLLAPPPMLISDKVHLNDILFNRCLLLGQVQLLLIHIQLAPLPRIL